jgi:exopolysaccharide production protein ExoZ
MFVAHPMASSQSSANAKLFSVQYLRALAALAVVAYHASNALLGSQKHLINLEYGTYGVDMFFVVSGFIMFHTTYDRNLRPGNFFLKRLLRIFPLYFILSTLMFLIVILKPSFFSKESSDFTAYCESIFFVPHWNPRLHDFQPILGPGWTLNYEMFFYALFAGSLILRHRLKSLAVLPIIVSLVFLGCAHPIDNPILLTYTSPLMLEFCFGIVVACAFVIPSKLNVQWATMLVIVMGAGMVYVYLLSPDTYGSDLARPFFVGLPCAILLCMFVAVERFSRLPHWRLISAVGDASYSLYLVQVFTLGAGLRLWRQFGRLDSILSHVLFICFIVAVSIFMSLFIYQYLELRLGRYLTSKVQQFGFRWGDAAPDKVSILK